MITSRVKPYDIGLMSVNWIEKKGNFETLSEYADAAELRNETISTINNGGKAFAIFEKKILVGIYLFEKKENYFANKNEYVEIGNKKFDTQKFWFGDNTSALVLTKKYIPEMPEEIETKISKNIADMLKGYIYEGTVAGGVMEDTLYFRKNVANQKSSYKVALGYFSGFAIGFAFGYFIFHEWWMGLCFGACYMSIFGGASVATAHANETGAFDLNNISNREEDD